MKTIGMICLSVFSGFAGGIVAHIYFPTVQSTSHEIHLTDNSGQCDLTSRGLHIKWKDGREVDLTGQHLELISQNHHVTLGASDVAKASYLVLDGKVWNAPSNRNKIELLTNLAGTGELDFNQIEDHQPN